MQREVLGDSHEIRLPAGTIRYRERGHGTPVVFVHGLLVNGLLWRKVVPGLDGAHRCIVPDWPLGSHAEPMAPGADLTPFGVARTIADFLEALDLDDVILVGNDTGGALCQMVATRHPERIGRLVLTPSDAFDNFPPRLFHYLLWAARVPGAIAALLQGMRVGSVRRSPIAYGWLAKRPIDAEALQSYVAPALGDRLVRRDLEKVLRGIDPRATQETAAKLSGFAKPVLLAWAAEDRFFPFAHAERLAALFPDARLEAVRDSLTFVPEDQPELLARLISSFVQGPSLRGG